jgi:hypothetical protein
VGLIYVLRVIVERAPVSSHDNVLFLPQNEIFLPINLKPDVDLASVEIIDLREVVKFVVKNNFCLFLPWLQFAENFCHELSILLIVPAVVIVLQV